MFSPDSELLFIANHISWMFHVTIGLDPIGNFSHVEGLSYEVEPFTYEEMGRNHAPHTRPFGNAGKPGRITLKWGMIVRSKLFDWIHEVKIGKDFQKTVFLFQLSRKQLPLRIYQLSGCWPVSWTASNLSTEEPTGMSTEEVVLAYDNVEMYNLSAIAMLGELVDEPLADALAAMKPPALDESKRSTAKEAKPPWEFPDTLLDTWGYDPASEEDRKEQMKKLSEKWAQRKVGYSNVRKKWDATEADEDQIGVRGHEEGYQGFEATELEEDRARLARVETEFVASEVEEGRAKVAKVETEFEASKVDEDRKVIAKVDDGSFEASVADEGRKGTKGKPSEGDS